MKIGKKQWFFPKTLIFTVMMTGLVLILNKTQVYAQATTGLVQTHNSLQTSAPTDTAKGEIAIDAHTGQIIYQKNAQKKLPIASLSKLMTVYIVIQKIQAHELSWNDKVKISPQIAEISAIPGTTSAGLVSGREYTVRELCDAALIGSASGAAMALGQKVSGNSQAFADLMNQTAKKIGIKDATFYNASGLTNRVTHALKLKNVPEMAVNTTSAKSVAMLSKQLLHTDPKILEITKQPQFTFVDANNQPQKVIKNTNEMVTGASKANPDFPVDGLKTGTTENQEENLVATTNKDGKRIITVVLCTPRGQRFSQTTRLMEEVYNHHHTVKYDKKKFKKDVSVANGVDVVMPVKIKKTVYFWMDNNKQAPITKQVTIDKKLQNTDGSVMAPVKKNQKIGSLKLGLQKQKVAYVGKYTDVPVYTKKADEKAGFFTNLFRDIL